MHGYRKLHCAQYAFSTAVFLCVRCSQSLPESQHPSPQDDRPEQRLFEAVEEAVHDLRRTGRQRHECLAIANSERDEVRQEVDEGGLQSREKVPHGCFTTRRSRPRPGGDVRAAAHAERSSSSGLEVQGICAAPRLLFRVKIGLSA